MRIMQAIAAALALLAPALAAAQMPPVTNIVPPPQPAGAIPLGTGGPANAGAGEVWSSFGDQLVVRNVTAATLTPVLPAPGRATGMAMIVAPGGAFRMLSMRNEGWAVARRLADHGIAAFVLKYRLDRTPLDPAAFSKQLTSVMVGAMTGNGSGDLAVRPAAVADAQAAMLLVRRRAAEWHIFPNHVGFMGFSAGAITALGLVSADQPGTQPDVVVPVYPSMEAVPVPAHAPPMFAALASDDPLFGGKGFALIDAWQRAKRPVEFHLYERGSHGFGTGAPGTTTATWLDDLMRWLASQDMAGAAK